MHQGVGRSEDHLHILELVRRDLSEFRKGNKLNPSQLDIMESLDHTMNEIITNLDGEHDNDRSRIERAKLVFDVRASSTVERMHGISIAISITAVAIAVSSLILTLSP